MNRDPFSGEQVRFERTCKDFYSPAKSSWKTYVLGGFYFAAFVGGVIVVLLLMLV